MKSHRHPGRGLTVVLILAIWPACALAEPSTPAPAATEQTAPQVDPAFKARQDLAIINLRQLGLALFEFDCDYGSFPDEETAKEVKEATGKDVNLKVETADDCFRQLFDAEILENDKILTLQSPTAKPKDGEPAAKSKKSVFSYCYGASSAGNPGRPLVCYPLLDGKTTFDLAPLGGRAVVLFVDNSVRSFPIEKDGRVLINGKDLFDPAQPYWGGKKPVIKWPAK